MCTSVVWLWFDDASGIDGFLGSNTYTWITLGLLLWLPTGQTGGSRLILNRIAATTAPAPRRAAATIAAVSAQPGPSSGTTAAATGTATGPDLGLARNASSEPTGSTRPAAAKPQSSS